MKQEDLFPSFYAECRRRLVQGRVTYGTTGFDTPIPMSLADIREELQDVVCYAFMADEKIRRIQAYMGSQELAKVWAEIQNEESNPTDTR
jgi:hypothetical protein